MMDVNPIMMLYTLNLYNAVCRFHLNETGRKKKTKVRGGNDVKLRWGPDINKSPEEKQSLDVDSYTRSIRLLFFWKITSHVEKSSIIISW